MRRIKYEHKLPNQCKSILFFVYDNLKRMYFITFPYDNVLSTSKDAYKLISLIISGNKWSLLFTTVTFTRHKYPSSCERIINIYNHICLNNKKTLTTVISNCVLKYIRKTSKIHKSIEHTLVQFITWKKINYTMIEVRL